MLPLRESAHNSRAHSSPPARLGTIVQDERSASRDSNGMAAATAPFGRVRVENPASWEKVSEEGNSTRNYPPLTNTRACTYSSSVYGHKVSQTLPILRGNIHRGISPPRPPQRAGALPPSPPRGLRSHSHRSLRLTIVPSARRSLGSLSSQARSGNKEIATLFSPNPPCTCSPARQHTQ